MAAETVPPATPPAGDPFATPTQLLVTPGAEVAAPGEVPLYPKGPPTPEGSVGTSERPGQESRTEALGVGVEGETVVWRGNYALRCFFGRFLGLAILTGGWGWLAYQAWGLGRDNFVVLSWALGIVLGLLWLMFLGKVARARLGHRYELTNRRLFVSTGVFRRRRDQIELLRVQDVYVAQGLAWRMLNVGTVVVVSSEPQLPQLALLGVADPRAVMDLLWHHARTERDRRSVKVDHI